MLQGVVLNLIAFSRHHGNMGGQVFALFVITVAACEAGLALALFLTVYRRSKSLDSEDWQAVREAGLPPAVDVEPLPPSEPGPAYPTLPPAGAKPEEEPARV
jgi:NADH-quinone oxidoreductase subunit K